MREEGRARRRVSAPRIRVPMASYTISHVLVLSNWRPRRVVTVGGRPAACWMARQER